MVLCCSNMAKPCLLTCRSKDVHPVFGESLLEEARLELESQDFCPWSSSALTRTGRWLEKQKKIISYRSYRSKFIASSLFGDIRLLQWSSIHWPPNIYWKKTQPHPSRLLCLSVNVLKPMLATWTSMLNPKRLDIARAQRRTAYIAQSHAIPNNILQI